MSLFLGKIHYWLFNKIRWTEQLEDQMMIWAKSKDLDTEQLSKKLLEIGEPVGDVQLEDIIDTSNIHGWLQDKIIKAEARQAEIVTFILNNDSSYINELENIFSLQGKEAAKVYNQNPDTPQDIYTAINDFILEGMPCDRVSETLASDEKEYMWKNSRCLHEGHWQRANGDVSVFYSLRTSWIKSFVNEINRKFSFEQLPENTYRIYTVA